MTTRQSGTVNKALQILDVFLDSADGLSVAQLCARTGINKTTVLRLCATLEGAGMLQRDARMRYQLGNKVWRLAQVYRQQVGLEGLVRPYLQQLRAATGESVAFYVRDGDYRVCLYRENSEHPVRHHVEEGARLPLHIGVVGRVLLAFAGEPGHEYEQIRAAGYLIAEGREPWTASVAVPVLLVDGSLAGGLVVSGPTSRFQPDQHARALELALPIARELGAQLPIAAGPRRTQLIT